MKKVLVSGILASSIFSSAFAIPGVDFKAGIGYQMLSPSGYVNYDGDDIDIENDLNWDNSNSIFGYLEVGLPVLPSIRAEYLPTKFEGTGNIDKTIKFGDITLGKVKDRVYSKYDVNQIDIVAYYGLPIPFIKPKLGLAVKILDGNIYVKSLTTQKEENVDFTLPIPLVYIGADINIPAIPISLSVDGKGLAYDGNLLLDAKGTLKYEFVGIPFIGNMYVGAGYRYQRFKLKDVDIDGKKLNADLKFGGPLAEIGVQF